LLFHLHSASGWYFKMIKASCCKRNLSFVRPAGTSRGILTRKPSWYIFLEDDESPEIEGIGECSIIPGLSRETEETVDRKIHEVCRTINRKGNVTISGLAGYPSLAFGIETALTDMKTGGKKILFPSSFTGSRSFIRINGLVWMGPMDFLVKQVEEMLNQGFGCLKFKIGSLRPEEDLQLIESVRNRFPARELELRVDANGAYSFNTALEIMKKLADLEVHSIEQPIKPDLWEEMARLCMNAPVPVALDEELLGRYDHEEKRLLVTRIHPQFLVLKPGLLGGFQQAMEYIALAERENIGWWITSALESNIGLNAIAQWTFTFGSSLAQGLGTGRLYRQNISCPLTLEGDRLIYQPGEGWDLSFIKS
jgi:o-succinylbenzoate synthase